MSSNSSSTERVGHEEKGKHDVEREAWICGRAADFGNNVSWDAGRGDSADRVGVAEGLPVSEGRMDLRPPGRHAGGSRLRARVSAGAGNRGRAGGDQAVRHA